MYKVHMKTTAWGNVFATHDGHPSAYEGPLLGSEVPLIDRVNQGASVTSAILYSFDEAAKLASLVVENGYPMPEVTCSTGLFCPIRKV